MVGHGGTARQVPGPPVLEKGGGGWGGDGTQKFVYQKWPNQIFPIVNFVLSHDGHFGLGGSKGGYPPPLLLLIWCAAILILPWARPLPLLPQARPGAWTMTDGDPVLRHCRAYAPPTSTQRLGVWDSSQPHSLKMIRPSARGQPSQAEQQCTAMTPSFALQLMCRLALRDHQNCSQKSNDQTGPLCSERAMRGRCGGYEA